MKPTDRDWPTCACGCGEPVPVRKANHTENGHVKGEPCRYVAGHSSRSRRKCVLDGEFACGRCLTVKSVSAFGANKTRPDGLHPTCRACVAVARRAYYLRNKERINKTEAARQRANPDRTRATNARYLERNRAAHLERARIHASSRRARLKEVFVEDVHPLVVLETDDGVCGICGEDVDPFSFEVDHIIPIVKGGEHSYANTQPAHKSCNSRKRDRITI